MMDRETRMVRAEVLSIVRRDDLQKCILDNIAQGAAVHADRWHRYNELKVNGYVYETVNYLTEQVPFLSSKDTSPVYETVNYLTEQVRGQVQYSKVTLRALDLD